MEPVAGAPPDDPVDRLIVQLRAYVPGKAASDWRPDHQLTSGITLTFDTETTTDPSQRLRFGAYQLRDRGELLERGLFYAEDMPPDDLAVLRRVFSELEWAEVGERLRLRTRADFVESVLYGWGYETRALIIGFNLPFDLSRLAIGHTYAKGTFKGGFSFTLAECRPNVRVKHLSQRASFIDFAGKDGDDKRPDRGFFVDVKTLAATLTSRSHSLQSLTALLGTTPKSPLDSYDGPLTPGMVRYGMNDVQSTWECFAKLAEQYGRHGLSAGLNDLYSEASLGKAFLAAMNIRPWRQVQPKFPPELIGQIMSTYYGGRAEVHIRRDIVPVIHTDFLSMYPTVCTLMGLWRFVIAKGVTWSDATADIRRIIDGCTLDHFRDPQLWRQLSCIVQVRPRGDILPVRAVYEADQSATIGVNRLTSEEPLWFTLADVLAAKMLGGRSPEIISAIRFEAEPPQEQLRAITLEGAQVHPERDDFYRLLIDHRRQIQAALKSAPEAHRPRLSSAQQSLKILTNSTSYGIFMELNVQRLENSKRVLCYDHTGVGRPITIRKIEEPGRYFHPLLGTLITGAARLMLALAERNARDQGLDWAFCDTDSLAIANTAGLPTPEFIGRVRAACAWFAPLNPYAEKGPILQLEKVNYPEGRNGDVAALRPVHCLAISAKRYVLFDRGADGAPVIRKASAHGLGHLIAPYPDPNRGARIERIGAELWQEDLWRKIIEAHDAGRPDQVDYASLPNFDQPAASRYAATNQTLLKWFARYNEAAPPNDRVRPFNFLLSFQPKSQLERAIAEPEADSPLATRQPLPRPVSRYSSNLIKDRPPVFDRLTRRPVPWSSLRSISRALVRHHLHSEMKFRGRADTDRGTLRRRNARVWALIPIGKEADNLEEREVFGDGDEDQVQWQIAHPERAKLLAGIEEVLASGRISDRDLWRKAHVSHHTLARLRTGRRAPLHSLLALALAAEDLRHEVAREGADRDDWRARAQAVADAIGGPSELARRLGYSRQQVGRVLNGKRAVSEEFVNRLTKLFGEFEKTGH